MAIRVRVWSSEERLREIAVSVLAQSVQTVTGDSLDGAPSTAVVHVAVEAADVRGAVFVLRDEAGPGAMRSVLDGAGDGPAGLVAAPDMEQRLAPTVLAVAAGQVALPAELVAVARRPLLTNREKQVLALVVIGLGNREIGGRLHLAESTVKSHLFSSYRKLGVASRGEATRLILDRHTGTGLGILEISSSGPDA